MEANGHIFSDAVIEGSRFPVIEEEDHGDGLTEVVELKAGGADGGQDGGVGDGASGDMEFAGAEDEIGVGCCANAQNEGLALSAPLSL